MALEICFLLSGLGPSGGERAAIEHATRLAQDHGHHVTVALTEHPPPADPPAALTVLPLAEARERRFDIAVATWWRTALSLFELRAERHAYFIQNLEERLYRPGDVERIGALVTQALPAAIVTEAAWLAELLEQLQPGRRCHHVPNGIDKRLFAIPAQPPERDGPLRILIEGSSGLWFKGIDDALAVVAAMRQPRDVTFVGPDPPADERGVLDRALGPVPYASMPAVYAEADVLLKLSCVEGVFTPPLEAFHRGATCVVWPVTGHDEYVRHDVNGIVAEWDDIAATAGQLDVLARDRDLLAELQRGALETARAWPSAEQAAIRMDAALAEIAAAPAPPAAPAAAQLLADIDLAMEEQRLAQLRLRRRGEHAERLLGAERERAQALERRVGELEAELARGLRSRVGRLLAARRR